MICWPWEVAKFGAVGAMGLLVNMGAFNLIRHTTELPVVRASLLAMFVAVLFNYVGYRYWTYRDRDKTGRTRELTLFLLFSAVGAVIETGVLYLATYGFDWNTPVQSNVFKIVGIGIATLFRFWSYRTWVFKTLPTRPSPPRRPHSLRTVSGAAAADGDRRARSRTELIPPASLCWAQRTGRSGSLRSSGMRLRKSAKTAGCCWSSSKPAAVRLREVPGDGQADPGGVAAADRPLEDRLQLGRHAGALVGDLDDHLVAGDPGAQGQPALLPCIRKFSISAASTSATAPGCSSPVYRACPSRPARGPWSGRRGATPRSAA
ncbi:hypothetical protein SMICM17S_11362 [Streptomyces microflavus]